MSDTASSVANAQATSAEIAAKRYVAVFVSFFAFALIGIASFNLVVDPYAHYDVGLIPPAVQLTRSLKVQAIERCDDDTSGLILGSSRVLKLEPEYVRSIDGTAYYNAGVNYAKPEDFFALTKLYEESRGKLPQKVLIGVDVVAFNETLPIESDLLSLESLRKYLNGRMEMPASPGKWQELISYQYTKNSLRSIRHFLQERNKQAEQRFRDDGVIVYTKRESEIQNSTYDLQSAIDYNKQEYAAIFQDYERIGQVRWALFAELVHLLRSAGTEVTVFLTPDHPDLVESLSQIPNYAARTADLDRLLDLLSQEQSINYINLQSIDSFEGEAKHFVDGIHPLESNTRKMVRKMLCGKKLEDKHAVQ
jgi:hypothetical protein